MNRSQNFSRRRFLSLSATLGASLSQWHPSLAGVDHLPLDLTFRGKEKFQAMVAKAKKEGWATKPIGLRMMFIALELKDVPYVGFTLEIHDKVECPSCNLKGLDCWTFFEAVMAFARMLEKPKDRYEPTDLLKEIEWTRYRGGKCTGNYLDRIHYLNEWYFDNAARGNLVEITRQLGGAVRLHGRKNTEMTNLWKSYRYLKKNPDLRPKMAEIEKKTDALPVWYIPNANVKAIEPKLANGDVIGIVTKHQGGVCSHVGLLAKFQDKAARFMHASSNAKKVIIDQTISEYLAAFKSHIGIIVGRPLPTTHTVTDAAKYQTNLANLIKAAS